MRNLYALAIKQDLPVWSKRISMGGFVSDEQMELDREHVKCHEKVNVALQVLQNNVSTMEKANLERNMRIETKIDRMSHTLMEGTNSISARIVADHAQQKTQGEQIIRVYEIWKDISKQVQDLNVTIGVMGNRVKELENALKQFGAIKVGLLFVVATFIFDMVSRYMAK